MPKVVPHIGDMTGTSQPGFQIFVFHLKPGLQAAHWKRFKNFVCKTYVRREHCRFPTSACLKHSSNWSSACACATRERLKHSSARFFGRRPTTAPTAQHFSSAPRVFSAVLCHPLSCTCRFQNVLQLALVKCCRAPAAFRTYCG